MGFGFGDKVIKIEVSPFPGRPANSILALLLHPMSRLEELENLLDENPDDPFLIYALAKEYQNQSGTMQALLMFEHLVTNFPDYVAAYFPYAKILYSAGNRSEAIRLLQTGIQIGASSSDL
ncbi:MAG TPA: tetratricopeptide repeat protein, partial [Saprospiraceae bacterium]|nr:tetratricopeptide repeat protein [Saprospiraceae bacterium]